MAEKTKALCGPPAFVLGQGEICNWTLGERRHSFAIAQVRPPSQHAPAPEAGWLVSQARAAGMQAQAPLARQWLFLPRKLSSSLSLQVSTLVQLLGSRGGGRAGGAPPSPLRTTEGKRLVQAEADLCQEPGLLNFQASAMVLK